MRLSSAGLIIVLVICIPVAATLSDANGGEWMYGREIVIREQTGAPLDYYSLPVTLDAGNFNFSKAGKDGSDIRVTDQEGYERAFWIEDWNEEARHARIWISVPRIPANGETLMRIYYGNPDAGSKSYGGATFLFFDDFSGRHLNLENWNIIAGDIMQSNGSLFLPAGNSRVVSMIPFSRPVNVMVRYRSTGAGNKPEAWVSALSQTDSSSGGFGNAYGMILHNDASPQVTGGLVIGNGTPVKGSAAQATADANTWTSYDLVISQDTVQGIWGGNAGPALRDSSLSSGLLSLSTRCPSLCNGAAEFDWVAVRSYARTEPSATLSAEYPAGLLMQKAEPTSTTTGSPTTTRSPGFEAPLAIISFVLLCLVKKHQYHSDAEPDP